MARINYRAVIMDYAGDGERSFDFADEDSFFDLPADEVVDGLIRKLGESDGLKTPLRYELNAAKRFSEKNLICAICTIFLKDGTQSPFIAMIGPA